jgi:hypothetical protein
MRSDFWPLSLVIASDHAHNISYFPFNMPKSGPIKNGDFVIVVRGENKGQAAIVTHVIKAMADVIFPLRDVQKTLRLTSLHNRHPLIENHIAFEGRTRQYSSTEPGFPRSAPTTPGPSQAAPTAAPTVCVLPPSVDAAIVALCEALDAAHMDADETFVAHVDARLRSSRR